jgi:hypothetical protein
MNKEELEKAKLESERKWKEGTKLKRIEKFNIAWSIALIILNIVNAIIFKELLYIVISIMWLVIGFTEYSDAKIRRMQDYLIEEQNDLIEKLLKELKESNNG